VTASPHSRRPLAVTGVELVHLEPHEDRRGVLIEAFREEWRTGVEPVQWNLARSRAGTLRGVHVHPFHDDYVVVAEGRMSMGLYDVRRHSPTFRAADLVELDAAEPQALVIPRGVLHGSVHPVPTIILVGVSGYYALHDELGCRWDDPELGIPWPLEPVLRSHRDETAPSLAGLLDELEPLQDDLAPAR
jgi:dTDP-4-dehydrorhamnose 3,5-epimerase